MTGVGETMISALVQELSQLILSLEVVSGCFGAGKLPKTIEKCRGTLLLLEPLHRDAEQKQFQSEFARKWLADLQDIMYDLEDILEEFATEAYVSFDGSSTYNFKKKVTTIFGASATDRLSSLFKRKPSYQSRLDAITERLQEIQTLALPYGLSPIHAVQQQIHQTEASPSWRESTSVEPVIHGRKNKKEEIIAQLLKDEESCENYVVIPIVGKGGIGKTTLAQYVYNDEQLEGKFHFKAWVCVSDVYDVKMITTTILKAAAAPGIVGDISNLNEAQEKLKQQLTGRKFLIVLDDIWSKKYDDWDKLRTPFRHAAKGSKLIMTTRDEEIARMMISNATHRNIIPLDGLSDNDCWRLFQQHAGDGSYLVELQVDIVKKCKGFPLAAIALGGLLKSTVEKSQFQKILGSDIWSEESIVLKVLQLSYHHLPSHLKRVFAYCSVFPKDHEFEKMEVVLLWMAQGLLPPDNEIERMEDIGHKYFDDLVSRSLFEPAPSNKKTFKMHDLIHDMASMLNLK